MPPPHEGDKHDGSYSMNDYESRENNHGGPILGGEPEFYPVPAMSEGGHYINPHLPAPEHTLPYSHMPSNQYYKPYVNHQMVIEYTYTSV